MPSFIRKLLEILKLLPEEKKGSSAYRLPLPPGWPPMEPEPDDLPDSGNIRGADGP